MATEAPALPLGNVTYIEPDGKVRLVQIAMGQNIMQGAVSHRVRGIDAICGGACACATCHVYIHADWISKTGTAEGVEAAMLELVFEPKPNSRLSCQIAMTPELNGLMVTVPESQQ